jgi:Putative prokaryotic signal transducing protein
MDELVVVEVVSNQPEAAMLCELLRGSGIKCAHRLTNRGAGAADGLSVGGPQEIVVRQEDLESAREILGIR